MWHHLRVGTRARGHFRTGWRDTDVWLDPDEVVWFGELRRTVRDAVLPAPLLAGADGGTVALPGAAPRPLPRVRPRRPRPSRSRRLATRLLPTVVVVGGAGAGVVALLAARQAEPLPALPPLTPVQEVLPPARSLDGPAQVAREPVVTARPATTVKPAGDAAASGRPNYPAIRWRNSQALGLPHAGSLVDGVRLPVKSQDWVTWDPVLNRVPNRPNRLYGTDKLVRLLVGVIGEYRAAHPKAPRVVVGDISLRRGGEIDEHVSHENGLDVDVYYPRRDGKALPPRTVAQINLRLAQDLADRFVAAGAQIIFVGFSVPLHGHRGVLTPYPSHDNHMHVRIAPPR